MTKGIGVGLLGAGFIGQMHSLSLGDVGRARREPMIHPDLVAIAERDGAVARMMAERYGWREIVTDWRSLVARSDIELLMNAGPNKLHAEPSIVAAQNGKHIFCEKPLARSAEEAFSIFKAVEATGVKHILLAISFSRSAYRDRIRSAGETASHSKLTRLCPL
jgi:predicted dehydrogenase